MNGERNIKLMHMETLKKDGKVENEKIKKIKKDRLCIQGYPDIIYKDVLQNAVVYQCAISWCAGI